MKKGNLRRGQQGGGGGGAFGTSRRNNGRKPRGGGSIERDAMPCAGRGKRKGRHN